jgi:hypothetical protein
MQGAGRSTGTVSQGHIATHSLLSPAVSVYPSSRDALSRTSSSPGVLATETTHPLLHPLGLAGEGQWDPGVETSLSLERGEGPRESLGQPMGNATRGTSHMDLQFVKSPS